MGDHAEFMSLPDSLLWRRALKLYEQRDWFMVHEALEVLWKRSTGRDAEFYQALLQAAVSLYHFGNGNFAGARQLAKSAISRFADLPGQRPGAACVGDQADARERLQERR